MSAELREQLSRQVCNYLLSNERLAAAKAIMAFHPFGDELDILPFMHEAQKRGQEIWLPLTNVTERKLIPYRYTGRQMLKQGVYGIWEPDPDRAETVDVSRLEVMIVPGVAFDSKGGRMGYGGGYYDRFLATLEKLPFLVGVGFSIQVVEYVPLEPHDVLLDAVVSDKGFLHF